MAEVTPLAIKGAWLFTSEVHEDSRGFFREWFKSGEFESITGIKFEIAQANLSLSNIGVVRGIHFSTAPLGQAKWVTCANGSIIDIVVDVRPESPTFKKWEAVELTPENGRSVFIAEGLGHAFISLKDGSVVSYLLSTPYDPKFEKGINPLDPEIGITWPDMNLSFSDRDRKAPGLRDYLASRA